jgi:hypothetical protein
MTWLEALAVSAGLLLGVGGAGKLLRPHGLAAALFAAGLTHATRPAARLVAAVELVVGAAVVLLGGPTVLLAAAGLYAGFTGFVLWGLARPGRITTCGCSGRSDTPPTRGHALLNASATAVLLATAAAGGLPSWPQVWQSEPLLTAVLTAEAALVALLGWAVVAVLPRVAAVRPHPDEHRATATAGG